MKCGEARLIMVAFVSIRRNPTPNVLFSRFDALARSHGTILRLLAHDLLFSLSPSVETKQLRLTDTSVFDKIGGLSKGHMALEHVDVDEPKIV